MSGECSVPATRDRTPHLPEIGSAESASETSREVFGELFYQLLTLRQRIGLKGAHRGRDWGETILAECGTAHGLLTLLSMTRGLCEAAIARDPRLVDPLHYIMTTGTRPQFETFDSMTTILAFAD